MELDDKKLSLCSEVAGSITENIERVLIGKRDSIELVLVALLCNGHVLIEDVPGVGKTVLVNSLAASLDMSFKRVQCTPDMLPSDILGFTLYDINTGTGSFKPGPIMSQLFLADEINRTSPKTQAALLEAMEEGQITVDGSTYPLPRPFMVLATQNPIESVGTYPLPEAQMDRFLMRISLGYPNESEENDILRRFREGNPLKSLKPVADAGEILKLQAAVPLVNVSQPVMNYILAIVRATRTNNLVELGASPRASISLMKCAQALALVRGYSFVRPEDVRILAESVLAHRLILSKNALMKGVRKQDVLKRIISSTPVPVK